MNQSQQWVVLILLACGFAATTAHSEADKEDGRSGAVHWWNTRQGLRRLNVARSAKTPSILQSRVNQTRLAGRPPSLSSKELTRTGSCTKRVRFRPPAIEGRYRLAARQELP